MLEQFSPFGYEETEVVKTVCEAGDLSEISHQGGMTFDNGQE